MRRRGFLASVGMGVTAGLAGCFGGGGNDNSGAETVGDQSGTATGTPLPPDAQLSLERIDAPPQAQVQSEYTFTLHVSNSGGQPGVYRAPVSVRRGGDVSYEEVSDAIVYVEPGETQAADISITPFQFTGAANIRVESAQNQWRVEIVGRELSFGQSFETSQGNRLTVQRINLTESYVFNGPGGEQTVSAPDGNQYAFVYVRIQNLMERENFTPRPSGFRLLYGGSEYRPTLINRQTGRYRETSIQAGSSASGWIPYLVPTGARVREFDIKYSTGRGTNNQVVYWRRGTGGGVRSGAPTETPGGSGSTTESGSSTQTSTPQG